MKENAVDKVCVVGVCLFALGGLVMLVGMVFDGYERIVNFGHMGSYPLVVMAVGAVIMVVGIITTILALLVILLKMAFGKEEW